MAILFKDPNLIVPSNSLVMWLDFWVSVQNPTDVSNSSLSLPEQQSKETKRVNATPFLYNQKAVVLRAYVLAHRGGGWCSTTLLLKSLLIVLCCAVRNLCSNNNKRSKLA